MFSEDDIAERWIGERKQTTTVHKISFTGPFDGLPPNQPETDWFKTLRWRSLPGTKGAYDVALSLKLGGLYDSSKTLLSQVGQVDEVWYMAFHLRQNFWVRNPMATTGVNVDLELQVYGPDHVAIHQGKYKGTFNETKKGLWRVWREFFPLSSLFKNISVVERQEFHIAIKMTEPVGLESQTASFPCNILYAMGDRLLHPGDGDVKFQCPTPDGASIKCLYAHSTILKTRSPYFARMFASSFSEGDTVAADLSARFSQEHPNGVPQPDGSTDYYPRRLICMEEDIDLVHNIIYYIYTNKISFSTETSETNTSFGPNFPNVCDAEDIYALAHRLDLEGLKDKALGFLKLSCNPRNIIPRVLGPYTSLYDEMSGVYADYFHRNWAEIRDTTEFGLYFTELEHDGDLEETIRVFKRFRELIKSPSFRSGI